MTAHRCPAPWPAGSAPFAEEVLQVLDTATTTWCDPCRLRYVDMLTESADRGGRCLMAGHENYPGRIDHLEAALARQIARTNRAFQAGWDAAFRQLLAMLDNPNRKDPAP